jgi:cytochrome bd-type quinol oxidase subunit 2
VVSTAAHALLAGAQLACLALGGSGEPIPHWLRSARRAGLYVRGTAIGTLLLGAGAHIAVILLGREALPRIITPAFELLLTVPMCYVSVAGWLAWRSFRFRGRWHRVALAAILVYFPIGIPFHILTVVTGSTAHYAAFPEQYSLLIVPVMAVIIACLASLRLRERGASLPPSTAKETR